VLGQRPRHLACVLGARGRIAMQQARDQALEEHRGARGDRRQRRRVALEPGAQPLQGRAQERWTIGPQREDDAAERVQIRARIRWVAIELFGRQVVDGSEHRAGVGQLAVDLVGQPDDAEIGQPGPRALAGREQHVGGLEIAMDDAPTMHVRERVGELDEDRQQDVLASAGQSSEITAGHVLHDHVALPLVAPLLEHGHAAGVIEPRDGAELAPEAHDMTRVVHQMRAQQLDGDVARRGGVAGAVHAAHAAPPQQRLDAIAAGDDAALVWIRLRVLAPGGAAVLVARRRRLPTAAGQRARVEPAVDQQCQRPDALDLAVSDPAARSCELLVRESGTRVVGADFGPAVTGVHLREGSRSAVSFFANQDDAIPSGDISLQVVALSAGAASAGVEIVTARCFDRDGRELADATVRIGS
jgi:hypothetical protein